MRTAPSTSQSLRLTSSQEDLAASFHSLTSARGVATLLDVPYSLLIYHIHRHPARYQQFTISKRSGGVRNILAPVSPLKIVQGKLAQVLAAVYKPRPCVHGFTSGRSIRSNADVHSGRRWVLNLDLADFFGTINFGRVRGLFLARPWLCNDEVATILAQICCHNNHLPQGAPTSPVVSNMICARLDGELQRLARQHRAMYSRYADDITFSSRWPNVPSALAVSPSGDERGGVVRVGVDLGRVIESNGFLINPSKLRLRFRTQHQEVTGLTVNISPNVQRTYVRQVRAMLHAWRRHGLALAEKEHHTKYLRRQCRPGRRLPSFALVVKGKIDFLGMVRGTDDPVFRRLLRQYAELVPQYVYPFSESPKGDLLESLNRSLWVLESFEPELIGTAFALEGVGFVTCAHVLGSRTKAFRASKHTEKFDVEVLLRDEERLDLALIRIVGAPEGADGGLPAAPSLAAQRERVIAAGFPNYNLGDTVQIMNGSVAGFRTRSMVRLALLDAPIVAGMSGGPVLNEAMQVVGVARTGADSIDHVRDTEKHAAIPVSHVVELFERLLASSAANATGKTGPDGDDR